MSDAAGIWDIRLRLDKNPALSRLLRFDIQDSPTPTRPNRIIGTVSTTGAGGMQVSRLIGVCRPGLRQGVSVVSCTFHLMGVLVQMDGPIIGGFFDGSFRTTESAADAGATALAEPGDTGTGGGQQTTDFTDSPRTSETEEGGASTEGEASPTGESEQYPPKA